MNALVGQVQHNVDVEHADGGLAISDGCMADGGLACISDGGDGGLACISDGDGGLASTSECGVGGLASISDGQDGGLASISDGFLDGGLGRSMLSVLSLGSSVPSTGSSKVEELPAKGKPTISLKVLLSFQHSKRRGLTRVSIQKEKPTLGFPHIYIYIFFFFWWIKNKICRALFK